MTVLGELCCVVLLSLSVVLHCFAFLSISLMEFNMVSNKPVLPIESTNLRQTDWRGEMSSCNVYMIVHTFRKVSTVTDHTSQYTGDIFLNVVVRKVQL